MFFKKANGLFVNCKKIRMPISANNSLKTKKSTGLELQDNPYPTKNVCSRIIKK